MVQNTIEMFDRTVLSFESVRKRDIEMERKIGKKLYIHYGCAPECFTKDKVRLGRVINIIPGKPNDGFWCCPVNPEGDSWYEFCILENFYLDSLKDHTYISLKEGAKIYHFFNDDDINDLIDAGYAINRPGIFGLEINFQKMIDAGYDGVFYHKPKCNCREYRKIYRPVDVESVCIFNPDVIEIEG